MIIESNSYDEFDDRYSGARKYLCKTLDEPDPNQKLRFRFGTKPKNPVRPKILARPIPSFEIVLEGTKM